MPGVRRLPLPLDERLEDPLGVHFGNPVAEARLLTSGGGVVDLRNREVVEVSGADRLAFLHALTTQHLESLSVGEATTALILSPTGHVEHVLYGTDDGTSFLAWTEPGHGEALAAFLDSMRFAMRVEVRRREDVHVVWAGHQIELDPAWRVRDSDLGGVEAFLPAGTELPDTVGLWAFEAMRIAAAWEGVPPVLNVLVPRTSYEKILAEGGRTRRRAQFSAIYLDQPLQVNIERNGAEQTTACALADMQQVFADIGLVHRRASRAAMTSATV